MKYKVIHTTKYEYGREVDLCHNQLRLLPRNTFEQNILQNKITVIPTPNIYTKRVDFFGNNVHYFSIEQPHEELLVTSQSEVEKTNMFSNSIPFQNSISWESVKDAIASTNPAYFDARMYAFSSHFANVSIQSNEYAKPSFERGRPILDAVSHLTNRIYNEFKYVPGYTTISTPVQTVIMEKKGVCQDFAHVAISCIRSMGLAARYVSGYLETIPQPGKTKLKGADASHAWFSVYVPQSGWHDFDPTNNLIPGQRHITIGWGRDFADVTPLKGVVLSSSWHSLKVEVDVERIG
ncbi:MAG: transglutaminase family protein [Bacteroidota bacterium]|nr:transglutaminase family protein [Bacteroidota bacterium]